MNSHPKDSAAEEEKIESSLKDNFRLSSYEARAYIALLKQGKQNPKQLSTTSTVPLPRIYDTLESLMAKGFAVVTEEGSYEALPARAALRGRSKQFEQQFGQEQVRRERAEELLSRSLSEISALRIGKVGTSSAAPEISILKGFNSIANKFAELLETSSEIILVAKRAVEAKEVFIPILLGAQPGYSEGSALYNAKGTMGEGEGRSKGGTASTTRKRISLARDRHSSDIAFRYDDDDNKTVSIGTLSTPNRRMKIRIIVPRSAGITKEEVKQAKAANAEVRKSEHILFDMMITDSDDVIIGVPDPLSDEINHAVGIWVRNSSFAHSTRNAIEELWKSAERV